MISRYVVVNAAGMANTYCGSIQEAEQVRARIHADTGQTMRIYDRHEKAIVASRDLPSRLTLSKKEIESLLSLVSIAEAGQEDEGDYQGFDYKSMRSAAMKLRAQAEAKS